MGTHLRTEWNLPDFLDARRNLCGFATWADFARATGVAEATVRRLLREDALDDSATPRSRELLSRALRFGGWWDLYAAWHDDRVADGLPPARWRETAARAPAAAVAVRVGRPSAWDAARARVAGLTRFAFWSAPDWRGRQPAPAVVTRGRTLVH
jgi:hypothetical protein